MATEKNAKTVSPSPAKETPVAPKAVPTSKPVAEKPAAVKAAPSKPVAEKPAAVKAAPKKAAAKKPAAKKPAAPKKVAETLVIQAAGNEWDTAAVKEQVIAAYVAAGHTRSSISSLTVYIKPEEHKAYYVINEKAIGSVDI